MIQIHATLDDAGSCGKDGMRAVVGYVAYSETWRKFNGRWLFTLPQLQKESLHTSHDLRNFPLIGGMDDEAARLILAPFIEAIKHTFLSGGAVPICVITSCDAYENLSEKEKKFIRPPAEHSFEIAVMLAVRALGSPMHIDSGAPISIQVDESADVPRLYRAYEWLKHHDGEMGGRLGGICFLDDKKHPPIQAADMLGNAVVKTWRELRSGRRGATLHTRIDICGGSTQIATIALRRAQSEGAGA